MPRASASPARKSPRQRSTPQRLVEDASWAVEPAGKWTSGATASAAAGSKATPSAQKQATLLARLQRAIPRHLFNLCTGTAGGLYTLFSWCTPLMQLSCAVVLLTTVVYHGAHTAGHERWASKFMKVDVTAVVLGTIALVWSTPPPALATVGVPIAASLAIWLPSFGPLKGIPFNPILSVCHIIGIVAHTQAMLAACPVEG